ncbi:hypothetical protein [Methylocella sp.]|uniref:hypothetical protein n=1 Tax=Methylocella sp. TaxID=1978226 RepID=UPI0035B27727
MSTGTGLRPALLLLAAAALTASAVSAGAQTKHRRQTSPVVAVANEAPPLTVNKRSFLDPGPVAPVGSMSRYMTSQTTLNQLPNQVAQRSKYGNETLPRRFETPGRPSPIFEFDTPAAD